MQLSEIRESTIVQLLDKVRRHDYGKYLYKASITKVRGFVNEDITFDFPVTALIGPNGSGKSSVLGVAGCAYKPIKPGMFFPKSTVGDPRCQGSCRLSEMESGVGWGRKVDYRDETLLSRT